METIWKPITGWEGFYEVSNTGLIKSVERVYFARKTEMLTTTGILRPKLDKDCYLSVQLNKNGESFSCRINQLVARAFIENPNNKPLTDHLNGVRWDNRVENLRWATQSENIKSACELGRKINTSKPINQFTMDGKFIRRYEAIMHVEKNGMKSKTVNNAVRGARKTAYGFKWEYAERK